MYFAYGASPFALSTTARVESTREFAGHHKALSSCISAIRCPVPQVRVRFLDANLDPPISKGRISELRLRSRQLQANLRMTGSHENDRAVTVC